MENEEVKKEELVAEAESVLAGEATLPLPSPVDTPVDAVDAALVPEVLKGKAKDARGGGRPRRTGGRPRKPLYERGKPEFDHKIISVRRVARVVAGGRRFSFAVSIVLGDRKGSVGVGTGKGGDTSLAIEKGMRDAKKRMITLTLGKEMGIPHELRAKFGASQVLLLPNKGRGLVAGSSVRTVLDLSGVKNVSAKVLSGSKNSLNNARAALEALREVGAPRIAKYHGA